VEVHYDEGVANHIGLKPCATTREGRREASAEVCRGEPLSLDSYIIQDADGVGQPEGNTRRRARRVPNRSCGVREPGMCRNSLRGNWEASRTDHKTALVRIGKTMSRSR
jgi:hypothetical protein